MADKKKKPKPGDAIVSVNITKDVNGLARMVTTYESGLVTDVTYSLPGRGTGGGGSPFFRGKPILPDSVGAKIAENKLNNKVIVSIANERIRVMAEQMVASGELKKMVDAFAASGDAALSIAQALATWKLETPTIKPPSSWTSMIQAKQAEINGELKGRIYDELIKAGTAAQAGWDKGTSAKPDETKISIYDKDGKMTADLTSYIKSVYIEPPREFSFGTVTKMGDLSFTMPGAGFAGQFNKLAADFERSEEESKAAPRELGAYETSKDPETSRPMTDEERISFRPMWGMAFSQENAYIADYPTAQKRPERYESIVAGGFLDGELMGGEFPLPRLNGPVQWRRFPGGFFVRYPGGETQYYTEEGRIGRLRGSDGRVVTDERSDYVRRKEGMGWYEEEALLAISRMRQEARDRQQAIYYDPVRMDPFSDRNIDPEIRARAEAALQERKRQMGKYKGDVVAWAAAISYPEPVEPPPPPPVDPFWAGLDFTDDHPHEPPVSPQGFDNIDLE